jgi:hypothetical protein
LGLNFRRLQRDCLFRNCDPDKPSLLGEPTNLGVDPLDRLFHPISHRGKRSRRGRNAGRQLQTVLVDLLPQCFQSMENVVVVLRAAD